MASTELIRCPICLSALRLPMKQRGHEIYCGNCESPFLLANALPISSSATHAGLPVASKHSPRAEAGQNPVFDLREGSNGLHAASAGSPNRRGWVVAWAIGGLLLLFGRATVLPFMDGIGGGEFLFKYAFILFVIYFVVRLIRMAGFDNMHLSLVALALFESVGIHRFFSGATEGMQMFSGMHFLMLSGFFVFLVRYTSLEGLRFNDDCSLCSSSCGSSCGGCGD